MCKSDLPNDQQTSFKMFQFTFPCLQMELTMIFCYCPSCVLRSNLNHLLRLKCPIACFSSTFSSACFIAGPIPPQRSRPGSCSICLPGNRSLQFVGSICLSSLGTPLNLNFLLSRFLCWEVPCQRKEGELDNRILILPPTYCGISSGLGYHNILKHTLLTTFLSVYLAYILIYHGWFVF